MDSVTSKLWKKQVILPIMPTKMCSLQRQQNSIQQSRNTHYLYNNEHTYT